MAVYLFLSFFPCFIEARSYRLNTDQLQDLGQDIELVWGFAHMQASNLSIDWLGTRLYLYTLAI